MPVDLETQIEIDRPRRQVAAYASEPDNATARYENIRAVDWKTPRPVAVGSRIVFVATFLGGRLAYTYECRRMVTDEPLVMRTAEGPFAIETAYTWEDAAEGRTIMTLRNRGEPSGSFKLLGPVVALAIRRANRRDLARLNAVLEAEPRD